MRTSTIKVLVVTIAAVAMMIGVAGAQEFTSSDGTGAVYGDTATTPDSDTATLTAAITDTTLTGTREITSVAGGALDDTFGELTDGSIVMLANGDGTLMQGLLGVTVTETLATGTDWALTVQSSNLTNGAGDVIANSNLSVANRSLLNTVLLSGVSHTTPTNDSDGDDDLSAERTLVEVSQDTAQIYSDVYQSTADLTLTPPEALSTGTYTSTVTVTLYE